jgi:hypothetical protein
LNLIAFFFTFEIDSTKLTSTSGALLRGGEPAGEPLAEMTFGCMVSGVEAVTGGGWRLTSKGGEDLGSFDWLVITSTGKHSLLLLVFECFSLYCPLDL